MIIRKLDDAIGSDREIDSPTWTSRRLLLADDNMGFSLHDTLIKEGTETKMWYQHHLEAVYCIEGKGSIEDLETGETHWIEPGTVYALDGHERHILRAEKTLRMVCVFNPPVTGREVHDETGAYPKPAETPSATSAQAG